MHVNQTSMIIRLVKKVAQIEQPCILEHQMYFFFIFQTANVMLMVRKLWNVEKSMVIALARRDSQEANVMNANQISLETSVTHAMKPSLIIHHARVCLKNWFMAF